MAKVRVIAHRRDCTSTSNASEGMIGCVCGVANGREEMTTPTADERVAEIEARAKAATPGPWELYKSHLPEDCPQPEKLTHAFVLPHGNGDTCAFWHDRAYNGYRGPCGKPASDPIHQHIHQQETHEFVPCKDGGRACSAALDECHAKGCGQPKDAPCHAVETGKAKSHLHADGLECIGVVNLTAWGPRCRGFVPAPTPPETQPDEEEA